MIGPSGNVGVNQACGVTDMRRDIDGLSAPVETVVKEAPARARSSASAESALTGSNSFGGTARGSACSTRFGARVFSLADGKRGRRAPDAGAAFHAR